MTVLIVYITDRAGGGPIRFRDFKKPEAGADRERLRNTGLTL